MTDIEEFEIWYSGRAPEHKAYAELAWIESRKIALEDAAIECDKWSTQLSVYDSAKCATAETCAGLVRDLKSRGEE